MGSNGVRLAAAVAGVAIGASARANTYTWSAAGSGNFSVAGNWDAGVPASAADTQLNFTGVNATYAATNDLGTTAAAPFVLNRLVVGTTGTPTVAGGFLSFAGATPTIQKLSGGGTPTVSAAMVINNGLTVAGNALDATTLSGAITGAGGLAITGGSISLTSVNSTYAGGTTLSGTSGAGEIVVFADSTLTSGSLTRGPLGTGTLSLNGGGIRTNSANARIVYNALNIGGNVNLASSSGNNLTFAGATTIAGTAATRTLTIVGTKAATFAGAIGDAGANNGLTIAGTAAGSIVLGGGAADTAANTYTGTTTLNSSAGTLMLDKANGTNAIAGNLNYQAGTLTWNRANQIADTASVNVLGGTLPISADETVGAINPSGGTARVSTGVSVSTGTATVSGTGVLAADGTLSVTNGLAINGGTPATGSPVTVGGTLTVGGLNVTRAAGSSIYDAVSTNNGTTVGTLRLAGDVTINASTSTAGTRIRQGNGLAGSIDLNGAQRTFAVGDGAAVEDFILTATVTDSGAGGGIRKSGAGTMALVSGASGTVTGASVVENGTLAVYNYVATPTVGSGATGSGLLTVNGGATLAGNGKVAALSVAGTVDPSIPSASNLGGTYSTTPTLVANSAAFASGGTLHLDGVGSAASDKLTVNGLLDLSAALDSLSLAGSVDGTSSYTLATYGSLAGTFDAVTFNGGALPDGYAIAYTSTTGAGSVVLQPAAVPEPATLGVVALGAVAIVRRRRR